MKTKTVLLRGVEIGAGRPKIIVPIVGKTEQPADNAQAADDSQAKDETPKTGQSLNPKYVLCIGVMLLGIYMILTSERQEKQRKRANG